MPPRTPDSVLAPFTHRLGREPDHLIAAEAGVSRALIIGYRKRLGIPAYEGYKFGQSGNPVTTRRPTEEAAPVEKAPSAFRGRRSALDPYADMLGKVPDGEIARLAGVTPENVRTYRSRRGIAASWQQKGGEEQAAPAPVAAPPAPVRAAPAPKPAPVREEAPAQTKTAYLVNVDRNGAAASYAIIATDFADAAKVAVGLIAKHQAGASIKAIQRIAELLD